MKLRRIATIAIVVIVIGGFHVYWQRTAHIRVVKAFVQAVERQDVATIYQLTIPQEREQVGVTPEAIHTLLEASLWQHGRVVGKIHRINLYGYFGHAFGEWLNAKTGQPIPANFKLTLNLPEQPKGMVIGVSFVLTPEGWRVDTVAFLAGRCFQAFGNLTLCHKVGIKGHVDVRTGYVFPLSELEQVCALLYRPQ